MEIRDLFGERLTAKELVELAERAGGVENLVGPTRRAEIEGMSRTEIHRYLLEDPSRVRRPIIDTGDTLYVGFSKAVQEALAT